MNREYTVTLTMSIKAERAEFAKAEAAKHLATILQKWFDEGPAGSLLYYGVRVDLKDGDYDD